MFSAQVGLAGSAKVGNWVVLGGQVGVNGHIEIKDGVQVGAKAGIVKTTSEKGNSDGLSCSACRTVEKAESL